MAGAAYARLGQRFPRRTYQRVYFTHRRRCPFRLLSFFDLISLRAFGLSIVNEWTKSNRTFLPFANLSLAILSFARAVAFPLLVRYSFAKRLADRGPSASSLFLATPLLLPSFCAPYFPSTITCASPSSLPFVRRIVASLVAHTAGAIPTTSATPSLAKGPGSLASSHRRPQKTASLSPLAPYARAIFLSRTHRRRLRRDLHLQHCTTTSTRLVLDIENRHRQIKCRLGFYSVYTMGPGRSGGDDDDGRE